MYYRGIGVKANATQAEIHLRQAAEAGFIAAQVMLGDLLAAQNQVESMTWYRKAAAKGSGDAAAALAQHSLTGKLTGRDPLQAMRHTRFAADRRHPEALRIMGDLYRYGLGVKADPHAAHDYYHRAATLGCATAKSCSAMPRCTTPNSMNKSEKPPCSSKKRNKPSAMPKHAITA